MVKKVVRRAEVKGHRHGFRVSGVLLIEAADNPRPIHKLCHQTQLELGAARATPHSTERGQRSASRPGRERERVGANLRYLVRSRRSGEPLLACLLWSSPARKMTPRDQ